MRSTRIHLGAVLAATAALVAPAAATAKPRITMSGSTSVAPLANKLAKKYVKACHHCVRFKILQGGSDVGIADVGHGRVTIGNSSRDPKKGDPGGVVFNKVARDAICLTTNRSNRLPALSQAGVQTIFSGGVRNWSGVPGATVGGPIHLFVRSPSSGTQDAFDKIFMKPKKVSSTARRKGSNGLVRQSVKGDKQGIGYVSLAFTKGTHAVRYKGVRCSLRNAKAGTYGGTRNFWMVTRGKPKGAAKKFIKWVRHNRKARKIVASRWVPLR